MKNTIASILISFLMLGSALASPPPIEPPWVPWVPGPPGPTPTGPLVLTKAGQLSIPAASAPHGAEIFRSDDGGQTWVSHANIAAGASLAVDMTKPSRLFTARIKLGPPVVTITSTTGTISGTCNKRTRDIRAVKSGTTKKGWQKRTHLVLADNNTHPRLDYVEFSFPTLTAGTWAVTVTDHEGLSTTQNVVVTAGFAPAGGTPTPFTWWVSNHAFRYDYWAEREIFPPNKSLQMNQADGHMGLTSHYHEYKYGPAIWPDPQHCEAFYFGPGADLYLQTWDGPCGQPSFYRAYPGVAEYSLYQNRSYGVAGIISDQMGRVSASSISSHVGPGLGLAELKEFRITVTLYKMNQRYGDSVEFEGCPEFVVQAIGGYEGVLHNGWDTYVRIFVPANSIVDLTPAFAPLLRGWYIYQMTIQPL